MSSYLGKKGYSILPRDALDYTTNIVNQVTSRRRQHLERRNDFIQMMVDHEEETKGEEETNQQTDKQWKTLKKSTIESFLGLY